ncbi:MAG: IreB family regulatory phosphoprotein [Firmicutes bacterium]|nr:IreB family regulatory phosphoprotein [Bacillota bacterium]
MRSNFPETQRVDAYRRDGHDEVKAILEHVYVALQEKGYDRPFMQIVGYILSGDPTYITSHANARALIGKVERDELLEAMIKEFLREVL